MLKLESQVLRVPGLWDMDVVDVDGHPAQGQSNPMVALGEQVSEWGWTPGGAQAEGLGGEHHKSK